MAGDAATSRLIELLSDPSWRVREKVVVCLGGRKDPAAIAPLIRILSDPSADELPDRPGALLEPGRYEPAPRLRRAASEALVAFGPDASAGVSALLSNGDPAVRKSALGILARIEALPDPGTIAAAGAGKDPELRELAAELLGRTKDARAVPHLLAFLKDDEYQVRRWAASGLEAIGDPLAVPALIEALGDPDGRVVSDAIDALQAIGDPRCLEALLALFRDPKAESRRDVVGGLLRFEDPRVIPLLLSALADEDHCVRFDARHALRFVPDLRAVEALLGVPRKECWNVREGEGVLLGETLKKIGKPVLPILVEAARGPDAEKRRWGVHALGELGDPEGFPALVERVRDPEPSVAAEAVRALAKIEDSRRIPALLEAEKGADGTVSRAASGALNALARSAPGETLKVLLASRDSGVRSEAAWRCGVRRFAPSAEPLARLLATDESPWVRSQALTALVRIGSDSVRPLTAALRSPSPRARALAILGLAALDPPGFAELILTFSGEETVEIRRATTWALGRFPGDRSIAVLSRRLAHPDRETAVQAAISLVQIGDGASAAALVEGMESVNPDVRRACVVALGCPERIPDPALPPRPPGGPVLGRPRGGRGVPRRRGRSGRRPRPHRGAGAGLPRPFLEGPGSAPEDHREGPRGRPGSVAGTREKAVKPGIRSPPGRTGAAAAGSRPRLRNRARVVAPSPIPPSSARSRPGRRDAGAPVLPLPPGEGRGEGGPSVARSPSLPPGAGPFLRRAVPGLRPTVYLE
ncbi:MAG: HEAT repeat domain-containing protein [Planctomycetes bacterium]|nr:HEAT repeat domain-containing protein [Planctomycetota bacterium]